MFSWNCAYAETPCATAWYEWYPADSVYFDDVTFDHGDSVTVTVTATSLTSGTTTFTNNSKGKSVTFSANSTFPLCMQDAEWIVEDFTDELESAAMLPNFDLVHFKDASVIASDGSVLRPSDVNAWTIDIRKNGTVYTSSTLDNTSVTCKYVGP